jgi:bacterioferritin
MTIFDSARNIWRRIHNGRRRAIDILAHQYTEEMETMLRLQWHAEQVRYSQFSERLLSIAKEEQRHAQWLARRIRELGGEVPKISIQPEEASSGWQALSRDAEDEKRCCADLAEDLATAKDLDPDTARVLERILQEEKKHLQAINAMQMRSDPHAQACGL